MSKLCPKPLGPRLPNLTLVFTFLMTIWSHQNRERNELRNELLKEDSAEKVCTFDLYQWNVVEFILGCSRHWNIKTFSWASQLKGKVLQTLRFFGWIMRDTRLETTELANQRIGGKSRKFSTNNLTSFEDSDPTERFFYPQWQGTADQFFYNQKFSPKKI